MDNKEISKGFIIINLTVDGTEYYDVEFMVNPNRTIRKLIEHIIHRLELPKIDTGGNPIQYLLGQILENNSEPEILEFENEEGIDMTLLDYKIQSGSHLYLISVPIAGKRSKVQYAPARPAPELESVLTHNATGRDTENGSIFDWSKSSQTQRHLMPAKSSFLKKMFRNIKGMFSQQENVNSTVFAPYMAERGEVMTVQVLLYKDSQYAVIQKRAKMVDPYAEEKNNQVIGLPLKKGDVVSAHLSFFTPNVDKKNIVIEENNKQIVWNSNIEDITFSVFIDESFNRKLLNGKVIIKLNDIPVTEMTFNVKIVGDRDMFITALTDISATKFDKVFISYSHVDTDKVQYISETCRALKCDYFFDRHSLEPGDIYPEKIFKYIDNANLFILCWSENAAASEWVEKERNRAMSNLKRCNHFLRFYPISIPPKTDLPDDMKELFSFGELS